MLKQSQYKPIPPALVTTPITETPDQRKQREALKLPLPHISYVAHSEGYRETKQEAQS